MQYSGRWAAIAHKKHKLQISINETRNQMHFGFITHYFKYLSLIQGYFPKIHTYVALEPQSKLLYEKTTQQNAQNVSCCIAT
jgi:hypothetical protein